MQLIQSLSIIGLLTILICMINCNAVRAVRVDDSNANNFLQVHISSAELGRKLGEPLPLEKLGLGAWSSIPENIPTKEQLLKLSIRLRGIARYLGSNWAVNIPIVSSITGEVKNNYFGESLRGITDIKEAEGSWTSLTVGQALNLVTKELQIIEEHGKEQLIDLLVRDEVSDIYRPILGVPLSRYCYEVLEYFKCQDAKRG